MGSKRTHDDMSVDGNESNSPGPEASNGNVGPSAKKRKFSGKGKHKAKEGTLEYSKKRARTIERLFQRNQDLPADVRNDMERELAAHRATVADKSFQKRRTAMISKYHMVRFFERKKAMRLVKQLKVKIGKTSNPEDLQKLQHELHVAKVDEAYAMHHPHAEPYISIYGKQKKGEDDEAPAAQAADPAGRPPMWATVEKAMEEGPEALKALRERRSPHHSTSNTKADSTAQKTREKKPAELGKEERAAANTPIAPTKGGKQPQNRRERRQLMRKIAPPVSKSEDEDDGEGFFEEA